MNFLKKILPFIPNKGNVSKFVSGLIFYFVLPIVGIPVATILLGITVLLAVLVPVVVILIPIYSLLGLVMVILGFTGALEPKAE